MNINYFIWFCSRHSSHSHIHLQTSSDRKAQEVPPPHKNNFSSWFSIEFELKKKTRNYPKCTESAPAPPHAAAPKFCTTQWCSDSAWLGNGVGRGVGEAVCGRVVRLRIRCGFRRLRAEHQRVPGLLAEEDPEGTQRFKLTVLRPLYVYENDHT